MGTLTMGFILSGIRLYPVWPLCTFFTFLYERVELSYTPYKSSRYMPMASIIVLLLGEGAQ